MSNKPLANPTAFTGQAPPWSLTQLDANFTAIQATINDTLTYANYFVDQSGVANSVIVSIPATLAVAITAGTTLYVKINNTNTGATTITINALAAQSITSQNGAALVANQLLAGAIAELSFDGSNFQYLGSSITPPLVRTAAEISAGVTPTNFTFPPGDVRRYGAKGDGTTDDATAIQNALNASVLVYLPPPSSFYRCASGITVPQGSALYSLNFGPNNPQTGVRLVFDLSVATCVTMGGGSANNGTCSVKGFTIGRAAGTPPAGSIGLLNQNTYASLVEDIACISHQVCAKFQGDRATKGIACMVNRLWTGAAYDSHCVIDTFPECRFNQCRYGMNGAGDVASTSYVRIQGGSTSNAANGPNTLIWNNCQFNQGASVGTRWVEFVNQTPGTISDLEMFQFNNCYIEDNVVGIFSDSTWTNIINFFMSNCLFNPTNSNQQFLSLNAATQISNWQISNCNIKCQFTINPTPQVNFLTVADTEFLGLASITVPVNSVVLMSNVTFAGLTLAGSQQNCRYTGAMASGALTMSGLTASTYPLIELVGYNGLTSWSPTLTFGGASVGITYSVRQGLYQIDKNTVTAQFSITLTSKGSSVGAAALNIPVADNVITAGGGGGGTVNYATGMAGLTSGIILEAGGGQVNLYQYGATGISALADTNFSNTSVIKGTIVYARV